VENVLFRAAIRVKIKFFSGLRILSATVDDDVALDGGVVVAKHVHFARAAPEASARVGDRLALRVGRRKRWLDTGSLKRNPRAGEPFRWPDLNDLRLPTRSAAFTGKKFCYFPALPFLRCSGVAADDPFPTEEHVIERTIEVNTRR
jgi:hypothetical protein